MTADEARKRLEEKRKQQQTGTTISPNPSKLTLKWGYVDETVTLPDGRKANIPSGAFNYQEKAEDGTWVSRRIPQKKFAIAVIDHQFVQINGAEFENNRMVRSYWTNEMRMNDLMANPFLLKIKGPDKTEKPKSYVGTYQELKRDHGIKGRLHVIYGITPDGTLVRLVLPYYSYSLGTDKFKTHGHTFLDADAKAKSSGGMITNWLTYDGHMELVNGKNTYTAPRFVFEEKLTDEIIIKMAEASDVLDDWYAEYHKTQLGYIDKLAGNAPDSTSQGNSQHGAENQTVTIESANQDTESWEDEDNEIPF